MFDIWPKHVGYLDIYIPCSGDTFPVGCKPGQSVVFVEDSFLGNPDLEDGRYNTELGMYQPGCGIENLLMSWGHDEYLYQVTSQYPINRFPQSLRRSLLGPFPG